jgi:hypothetical protein
LKICFQHLSMWQRIVARIHRLLVGFDRFYGAGRSRGILIHLKQEAPEIPKFAVPVARENSKGGRNDLCPVRKRKQL